jgi:hypothetical protein
MTQTDDQGWEVGNVLPFAQRPIPYANALQPKLAVPGFARDLASSLGQMLTIPGQALRGELGQQPEQLMQPALQVASGMLSSGLGVGRLAEGAAAKSAAAVAEKDPFMTYQGSAAAPLAHADSFLNKMEQTPGGGWRIKPTGPGLSDATSLEVSRLENEADKALQQKMASGQWKGLPARLPDWIRTDADRELYESELAQHSKQTNSMMRDLGISALQKGHKLEPVEHDPFASPQAAQQFVATGGA